MVANKITNFCIVALLISALCQTGMLWLDETSGHNFFYSVFAPWRSDSSRFSGSYVPIAPQKIIAGYGNRRFSSVIPDENSAELLAAGEEAIVEALESAGQFDTKDADWKSILNYRCLLLKYHSEIPLREFARGFSAELSVDSDISFDYIAIYPSRTAGEYLRLSFINADKSTASGLTLQTSSAADPLYDLISRQMEYDAANGISYISTAQSGFNIFEPDVFVPQWEGERYNYSGIKRIPAMEEGGAPSSELIEKNTESFFAGSIPMWIDTDDGGGHTISNDNIVLKYSPTGVLEYYNYSLYDEDSPQSLTTAYSTCRRFLGSDVSLLTGYYLEATEVKNGEITFFFNYQIDGYPIILSNDMIDKTGLRACIEITVKNNSVRRYRRYAYNFEIDTTQQHHIDSIFITALDNILTSGISGENDAAKIRRDASVDEIFLFYPLTSEGSLSLKWLASIDGEYYIADTVSE